MKRFTIWMIKIIAFLATMLGIFLAVWLWFFTLWVMLPCPAPKILSIDLVGPTIWKFPLIDILVMVVLAIFALMASVHTPEEKERSMVAKGIMNLAMMVIWMMMEFGPLHLEVTVLVFTVVVLVNTIDIILFLVRSRQMPTVIIDG